MMRMTSMMMVVMMVVMADVTMVIRADSRCTAVTSSEVTTVTCHFGEDINVTKKNFHVQYFASAESSDGESVLFCNFDTFGKMTCKKGQDVEFNEVVSESLTMTEPTSQGSVGKGRYVCQLVPPPEKAQLHPCILTSEEVKTTTTTTSKTTAGTSVVFGSSGTTDDDTAVILSAFALIVAIVAIIIAMVIAVFVCKKRNGSKNSPSVLQDRETEGPPLTETDKKEEEGEEGGGGASGEVTAPERPRADSAADNAAGGFRKMSDYVAGPVYKMVDWWKGKSQPVHGDDDDGRDNGLPDTETAKAKSEGEPLLEDQGETEVGSAAATTIDETASEKTGKKRGKEGGPEKRHAKKTDI